MIVAVMVLAGGLALKNKIVGPCTYIQTNTIFDIYKPISYDCLLSYSLVPVIIETFTTYYLQGEILCYI